MERIEYGRRTAFIALVNYGADSRGANGPRRLHHHFATRRLIPSATAR